MASVNCSNCKGIPRDSVDSDCCNQIYCWSCVVNGVACSFCGNPVDPAKCKENLAVRRIVDSIPTNCKYEGCNVSLPRDTLKAHELECEFKPCMCPNSDLCGIFIKRELKEHLINECDYRTADCAFKCGAVIKAKDFKDHVSQDCPEVTIFCSNMCNAQMKRGALPFHMENECPFQPTPCEFAEFGCTNKVLKIQYAEHLETDMKKHFALLSKAVKSQSIEIKELKQKVSQVEKSGRPLIDATLISNGASNVRAFGGSAAQFIGRNLEVARIKGCELYANRVAIAESAKTLLETSRIAQFVLFYVIFSVLHHVPKPILFFLFLMTTAFTVMGMVFGRESFARKVVMITAWACIFGLLFHAPNAEMNHHYRHHRNRPNWF